MKVAVSPVSWYILLLIVKVRDYIVRVDSRHIIFAVHTHEITMNYPGTNQQEKRTAQMGSSQPDDGIIFTRGINMCTCACSLIFSQAQQSFRSMDRLSIQAATTLGSFNQSYIHDTADYGTHDSIVFVFLPTGVLAVYHHG